MKSRLERVSPEFSDMLRNLKEKTKIPKVQITRQIAKEFKYEKVNDNGVIIDLWPFKHRAKLTKI